MSRAVKARLIHWLQLSGIEGFHSTQFGIFVMRNADSLTRFLSRKTGGFSEGEAESLARSGTTVFPYLSGTFLGTVLKRTSFFLQTSEKSG